MRDGKDIVERLRDQARTGAPKFDAKLELEAADEIARLREELKKQRSYPVLQEALKAWGSQ